MGILDDTAIFAAVIQQGGFSHAAKHLRLSNGLISRRIAELEAGLGVTLIKRTTRQLQLTPEGELFWRHAQRIQQELDCALSVIQSSAKKPKGRIRLTAPIYFGRHFLAPIIIKFLTDFNDIQVDLILSNQKFDPIKEELDLIIRGAGYVEEAMLTDSTMQMKMLLQQKIGLYASAEYLVKYDEPKSIEELPQHVIVGYTDGRRIPEQETWKYTYQSKAESVVVTPKFHCNDIDSTLTACLAGYGIAKFTDLAVKETLKQQKLYPILTQYDWGSYHLFAVYPFQQSLPTRTRLLLDFIEAHMKNI